MQGAARRNTAVAGRNRDRAMDMAWYAVQSKRFNEARVVRHLATKAVPAFLPFIEVVHRRRGMRCRGLEPLFPGYLFVRLARFSGSPHEWDVVRWSPGVRRILGVQGEPVSVPDDAIQAIQERMQGLGFLRPGRRFADGARVRFRSGPMGGLEAVLDGGMSRAGRVHVLLELLGNVRRIETDELELELA